MKKYDKLKNKIFVFIASFALTGIIIFLFFLDDSLEWNSYKIYSCIIVNLWIFFVIPAIRNSYLLNEGESLIEWFIMGVRFGASGVVFPILLAPYYGMKYYLNL